jgi:hypothetical protein
MGCAKLMEVEHFCLRPPSPFLPKMGDMQMRICILARDSLIGIYNNYIGETHYKSWIDFSQHASIPRHHPLYNMSPSTIRHVTIH